MKIIFLAYIFGYTKLHCLYNIYSIKYSINMPAERRTDIDLKDYKICTICVE